MHLKMNNLQDSITQAVDRWNAGLLISGGGEGQPNPAVRQMETEEQKRAREEAEMRKKEEAAKAAIAA